MSALVDAEGWVRGPNDVGWVSEGDLASDLSRLCSVANADFECEHGRLAGDACPSPVVKYLDGTVVQSWPHDHPCGCHASERITVTRIALRESTPNLMNTLKRAEEAVMETTTMDPAAPHGREADGTAKAPFGHKLDGTPKLTRGGRKPKAEHAAAQLAAPPATAVATEPEPEPPASACTPEQPCEDVAACAACDENLTPAVMAVHEDPIRAAVAKILEKVDDLFEQREQIEQEIADLDRQVREAQDRRQAIIERASSLNGAKRALIELFPDEPAKIAA